MGILKIQLADTSQHNLPGTFTYEDPPIKRRNKTSQAPGSKTAYGSGDQVIEAGQLVITCVASGVTPAACAQSADLWVNRFLTATRFYDGSVYLRLLQFVGDAKPKVTRGRLSYKFTITFDLVDRFWHTTDTDNSTKLFPY